MNIIKPRPHQAKAVSAAIEAFRTRDRATIVMPCGTGKTLIGPWVAEGLESRVVVIFVPSLWLLRQTVGQWAATTEWKDAEFFGVCSDKSVFDDLDISEITETRITTSPAVIREYFNSLNGGKHVVCCTYQSAGMLAEAIPEGLHFDFGIFDEAHCTAGEAYVGLSFGGFSVPLLDRHVLIRKRLFMTATPRSYEEKQKNLEGNNRYFSMDDTELYGERVYELTFAEAVAQGLIADYRIIISVITKQDVTRELLLSNSSDIESAANALALKAACKKYGIRKSILFFNTIDECAAFSSGSVQEVWPDVFHSYISSRMPASQRSEVMNLLSADQDISVSNARCLTMGIDVPAVDMVAFMRKKRGEIDIVQAVGRASRKDAKHPDKIGFIFLPLYLDDAGGEELSDALGMSGYEQVWTVLEAMRASDGRFDSWIRLSRAGLNKDNPYVKHAEDGNKIIIEVFSQDIDTETIRKSIDAKIIDRIGDSWDEMFGRLVEFKSIHGHCKVSRRHMNQTLARWYRYQIRTWDTRLNPKRRNLLIMLGVDPEDIDLQSKQNAASTRWTKEEIDYLKASTHLTDAKIAEHINRSVQSIQVKRSNLGLLKDTNKGRKQGWMTAADDKFIIDNWEILTDSDIAQKLGRHRGTICHRRKILGLNRGGPSHVNDRRFTTDEDEFIIQNSNQTDSEIALALNRARSSVARRRSDLGLRKPHTATTKSKPWTSEEDKIILENLDKTYNEVALMLNGRTGTAVYSRRHHLIRRHSAPCPGRSPS